LLAATSIIEGGDRDKVPVRGGPSTGAITIVEKIDGKWTIRRDDGRAVVQLEMKLAAERQISTPDAQAGASQMLSASTAQ
jgi:hypothetical protein